MPKSATYNLGINNATELEMILTQAQAEAVYSAMTALNNAGGNAFSAAFKVAVVVVCTKGERVIIRGGLPVFIIEDYDNQAAFAAAYGLQ